MDDDRLATSQQHGWRRSRDFEQREVSRLRVDGTIGHGGCCAGVQTDVTAQQETRPHQGLGERLAKQESITRVRPFRCGGEILPRRGGSNDHINAEGQIKLGKITATAVKWCYQAKESANALGVSPRTVKRNWAFARAWLGRELNPDEET